MLTETPGRDEKVRVRFAPSPTGPLHIGGLRTALYNYLFARKNNGTFILRMEDTDQSRYMKGAEKYISNALQWVGLTPDEGPGFGGEYGPYRQSERLDLYRSFASRLLQTGNAYYAFDTVEELELMRSREYDKGIRAPKYDTSTRLHMKNSLTLTDSQTKEWIATGIPYTIRLLIPQGQVIRFIDRVRGEVSFSSDDLDDKVLLKADGFPTYHLANIVDDHLMKVTHVIRGEEWLSSTGHHIFMYDSFGWKLPSFAHLPLILRPNGKGKLSKRDAAVFGIPVLPLAWDSAEGSFEGFKEGGFLPEALLNFLAFLGWNPGTEKEFFSVPELIEAFSIDQISKSGARFDFDKAKWYNNRYLNDCELDRLTEELKIFVIQKGYNWDFEYVKSVVGLLRERAFSIVDLLERGYYFFEKVTGYDEDIISKKWNPVSKENYRKVVDEIRQVEIFRKDTLHKTVSGFIDSGGLRFADYLPLLRIALTGSGQGPDLFKIMEILGKGEVMDRLVKTIPIFERMVA